MGGNFNSQKKVKPPYKEKQVSFYDFQKGYNPVSLSLHKILTQSPWEKDYVDDDQPIDVVVMLNPNFLPFINFRSLESKFSGSISAKISKGEKINFINGKKVNSHDIKNFVQIENKNREKVKKMRTQFLKKAAKLLTLNGKTLINFSRFKSNHFLKNAIEQGSQLVELKLTKNEIKSFVRENKNLILYISKKKNIRPLLHAQALMSNVDSIAFNGYHSQGQNIDILFTERWCPVPSWFNNTRYHIIDNATDTSDIWGSNEGFHPRAVGDILRYGASQANLSCGNFNNSVNSGFTNVSNDIDVENYSWGYDADITDNVYDQLSASLDNHIYLSRNTVCVSAGNIDNDYPNSRYVVSPAKALNAITVGAYNQGREITDYSAWENSDLANEKPEVCALGNVIDTHLDAHQGIRGTSFASPHVAAIASDYMSSLGGDWNHRTMGIKALIMASATDRIVEREDYDNTDKSVGVGGVHYHDLSSGMQVWEMFDGTSNDFTRTFYVSQNAINQGKSLRVVLTWLNTGDYAIAHKGPHAIGLDLDMEVNDPNGTFQAQSNSWDNPYEIVDFQPKIAGNYMITVSTYAYRDTSSYKKMGMAAVLY